MNLNSIRDNKKAIKNRKRIGRGIGSGTGKTSGKGHKGQKSRSGVSIKGFEGGQMPIHRRLPKRGFTSLNRVNYTELNFEKIESLISAKKINTKEPINTDIMLKLGIIKNSNEKVKLLAKGVLKSKINIEVSSASISAKDTVEKIGGEVIIFNSKTSDTKSKKKSED